VTYAISIPASFFLTRRFRAEMTMDMRLLPRVEGKHTRFLPTEATGAPGPSRAYPRRARDQAAMDIIPTSFRSAMPFAAVRMVSSSRPWPEPILARTQKPCREAVARRASRNLDQSAAFGVGRCCPSTDRMVCKMRGRPLTYRGPF
jgi:hypothetical protein